MELYDNAFSPYAFKVRAVLYEKDIGLKSDTDIDACAFVLSILKLIRPELAKELPQALQATQDAVARHHAYLDIRPPITTRLRDPPELHDPVHFPGLTAVR